MLNFNKYIPICLKCNIVFVSIHKINCKIVPTYKKFFLAGINCKKVVYIFKMSRI